MDNHMKNKDLFILPNGYALKYAMPFGSDSNKFYRTYDDQRVRSWRPNRKEHNVRLGFWNSGSNQHIVCADFDNTTSTFDQLYSECQNLYSNCIHLRSVSNRVKLLFVIEANNINEQIALTALKSILTPDHYALIDKSFSALSLSFVNSSMIDVISSKLRTLNIAYIVQVKGEENGGSNNTCSKFFKYARYPGHLSVFRYKNFMKNNARKKAFLRILLATPGLLSSFDLPVTCLAKDIGVSSQTIANYIKELLSLGWLKRLGTGYIVGKKAKSYVAGDMIKDVLENYYPKSEKKVVLPKSIANGQWHKVLWKVSACFQDDLERFYRWMTSVPGGERPDRRRHAYRAFKMREKYNVA